MPQAHEVGKRRREIRALAAEHKAEELSSKLTKIHPTLSKSINILMGWARVDDINTLAKAMQDLIEIKAELSNPDKKNEIDVNVNDLLESIAKLTNIISIKGISYRECLHLVKNSDANANIQQVYDSQIREENERRLRAQTRASEESEIRRQAEQKSAQEAALAEQKSVQEAALKAQRASLEASEKKTIATREMSVLKTKLVSNKFILQLKGAPLDCKSIQTPFIQCLQTALSYQLNKEIVKGRKEQGETTLEIQQELAKIQDARTLEVLQKTIKELKQSASNWKPQAKSAITKLCDEANAKFIQHARDKESIKVNVASKQKLQHVPVGMKDGRVLYISSVISTTGGLKISNDEEISNKLKTLSKDPDAIQELKTALANDAVGLKILEDALSKLTDTPLGPKPPGVE